jgi:hypothetical protein
LHLFYYLFPLLVVDVDLELEELPEELPDELTEELPDDDRPDEPDEIDEPDEPDDTDPDEDLPELTELPDPTLPLLTERPEEIEFDTADDDPEYLPLVTGVETLLLPLLLLPLLTGVLTLPCVELCGIVLLTDVPDEVLVRPPVLLLLMVLFTLLLFCMVDEFELLLPGSTVVFDRLVLYEGRVVTLGLL